MKLNEDWKEVLLSAEEKELTGSPYRAVLHLIDNIFSIDKDTIELLQSLISEIDENQLEFGAHQQWMKLDYKKVFSEFHPFVFCMGDIFAKLMHDIRLTHMDIRNKCEDTINQHVEMKNYDMELDGRIGAVLRSIVREIELRNELEKIRRIKLFWIDTGRKPEERIRFDARYYMVS